MSLTLLDDTNIPEFSSQSKYLSLQSKKWFYPFTDPSFFPVPFWSNSIPAHIPSLNFVRPQYLNVPITFKAVASTFEPKGISSILMVEKLSRLVNLISEEFYHLKSNFPNLFKICSLNIHMVILSPLLTAAENFLRNKNCFFEVSKIFIASTISK